MDFLQACVLALLQGLTEFLPISSTAHLILVPVLVGWPDQGLAFDVAVHVGTLLAVLAYFRADVSGLSCAWFASLASGRRTPQSHLAWAVIVATVPALLFGLVVNTWFTDALRNPLLIAATTLIFGLLLWWADRAGRRQRVEYDLDLRQALVIGLAQAIALLPGTSRSGVTITAGLALGLTRQAAARFSFLMAIPVIALAGVVKMLELAQQPEPTSWSVIVTGIAVSGTTAYLTIHYFLALVERVGLMPFVVYRLLLGGLLLYLYL